MDKIKVAKAIGAAALLIGAGIGAGFALDNQAPIVKEIIKEVPLIVNTETIKEVEVPVNVTVVEEVFLEDIELLEKVCDRLMFDDIKECREEVNAEDYALQDALNLINDEDELFDFLEDEGFVEDENDARLLKVYNDFDEVEVSSADFDDEEYEFVVKVRVEDEETDEKFRAYITVKVDEGEAEFVDVELA